MAGLIARVLGVNTATRNDAEFSEVKLSPGAGLVFVSEQFSSSGDDSAPLVDDIAAVMNTRGTGRGVAVGFIDPKNENKALPGERRLYSRDSNGVIKSVIWLKSDGTVTVTNDNGSFTLNADGNASFSGELTASKVSAPSIVVDGKELKGHKHSAGLYTNSGGPVTGTSGGNV